MNPSIRLKVKFRFMFRDLAKFDKAWQIDPLGVVEISPSQEPEGSKVLWNKNGVRLSYWVKA
jgi:hypothetical protein